MSVNILNKTFNTGDILTAEDMNNIVDVIK